MSGKAKERIRFHYLKSNHFRTVVADGFTGGFTNPGRLAFTVFSVRHALPQIHEYETDDGSISGDPTDVIGRSGFVRECEVTLVMNTDNARALYEWLGKQIKQEDLREPPPTRNPTP